MKNVVLVLILLTLALPANASVKDSLDFTTSIVEMKSHLDMAVNLLKQDDRELASTHAGHPAEEYWPMIGRQVRERNMELFQSLDKQLAELPDLANTTSPQEFETSVDRAFELLDQAEALVVPQEIRTGFIYQARVIISLLEAVKLEYGEAITETGELKELEEYQDSGAFLKRSQIIYQETRHLIDKKEASEIDEFFEDLNRAFEEKQPPSRIETLVNGIIHELEEIADLAGKEKKGSVDIIGDIKETLKEVTEEYEKKEYKEAEELAIAAYLEKFELVEGDLGRSDEKLVEELEQLMRVELRQLIRDRAPTSQVKTLVSTINVKLKEAEGILEKTGKAATPAPAVVQPLKKVDTTLWYVGLAVLLSIAIAEGVIIVKLKGRQR